MILALPDARDNKVLWDVEDQVRTDRCFFSHGKDLLVANSLESCCSEEIVSQKSPLGTLLKIRNFSAVFRKFFRKGEDTMRDNIYEEQKEFFQFQCFMKEIFLLQYGEDSAAQGYMPPHRGVAWWYSDVIGAVKRFAEASNELERERLLFLHLCYYRSIYGAFDATLDDFQRGLKTYQELRHKQESFKDRCRSLKWAEHQLMAAEHNNRVKADEKQVQSLDDTRFASVFWRIPLEEDNKFFG